MAKVEEVAFKSIYIAKLINTNILAKKCDARRKRRLGEFIYVKQKDGINILSRANLAFSSFSGRLEASKPLFSRAKQIVIKNWTRQIACYFNYSSYFNI